MAKLAIIKEPNEILHKVSKEVAEFSPRLHQLLDDMQETMKSRGGVGLAAVQVGFLYRITVIDTQHGVVEFINPVITKSQGQQKCEEGCLSIPDISGKVLRPAIVEVVAKNRSGVPFTMVLKGIDAICISHEIDHMDGVLFIDRIIS